MTTPDLDDAAIISASLEEPSSFGAIFERHFDRIFEYAARRLGEQKAADVAAETFTIAFRRRGDYDRSRADALPWLFGITIRLIRHHRVAEFRRLRALRRSTPVREILDEGVETRLDAQRAAPEIAKALEGLPVVERETLLLLAWGGLTYQEVAYAMDVPVGTVRSRLHRVRSRLRPLLGNLAPTARPIGIPTEEGNHG